MKETALVGLSCALVGPGRVGSSLASWARSCGAAVTALGVRQASDPTGRAATPATELAARLKSRLVSVGQLSTRDTDVLLIAVSDPALDAVVTQLARQPQARIVLHTSGSRGSEALNALRISGSAVGTLHPLKAFPCPLPDLEQACGTTFGVGGDAQAVEVATRLAGAWGGHAVEVADSVRPLYHFGATLAAGGAVTLVAAAADLARRLDLPPQVAAGYLELARGALATVDPAQPATAITGPVARGDRPTALGQLDELAAAAPDLAPLARLLARETLRLLEATSEEAGEALRTARGDLAAALDDT